jgi:peptide/nickel transport system permease protein
MNRLPAGAWVLIVLILLTGATPLITQPARATGSGGWLPPPDRIDLDVTLSPPAAAHWLGTDLFGRDLLSRLLHGGRVSLMIAIVAAALALLFGSALGMAAGLRRGWVDLWVGRLMEAADSIPTLLLALAVAAAGRGRGALPLTLIIAATSWTGVARIARAEALAWRATAGRESALAVGAPGWRLAFLHLGPLCAPLVLTSGALVAAEALMVEAGLGLVGFGIEPPAPTWGNLLLEARATLDEAWWPAVFPGLAIFAAVAALFGVAERAGGRSAQLLGAEPGRFVGGR